MVLDGAMCVNLVAGAVMNGVCCLHGINVEDEKHEMQKEDLRRTIGVEYERQRLFDRECRERMTQERRLLEQIEEQKRRLLLEEKQRADYVYAYETRNVGGGGGGSSHASRAVESYLQGPARPDCMSDCGAAMEGRTRSLTGNACPRRLLMEKKRMLCRERNNGRDGGDSRRGYSASPDNDRGDFRRSRTAPLSGYAYQNHSKKRNVSFQGMQSLNDDEFRTFMARMGSDDMTCISQTSTQISAQSLIDAFEDDSDEDID